MTDLRTKIREVPDFPTPGVGFKDFTPLLADAEALRDTVEQLATWVQEKDCDLVIGAPEGTGPHSRCGGPGLHPRRGDRA